MARATVESVLICRACRRQTGLTVCTVMERRCASLSTWFWAAYLVASQTKGISAVQFQRQLGLTRRVRRVQSSSPGPWLSNARATASPMRSAAASVSRSPTWA